MIFLFVIDTGGSMNQATQRGISLLDSAKSAVEHFLKIRTKDPASRLDKYLLVTCRKVVVGWNRNAKDFVEEVKMLNAFDLSSMSRCLDLAFGLLNKYRNIPVHRAQGIDTFGLGRWPRFVEPSAIVVLTDGHLEDEEQDFLTQKQFEALMATPSRLKHRFCKTRNRWDQRVYPLVLQFPGVKYPGAKPPKPSRPHPLLRVAAEATAGKVYIHRNLRSLLGNMENIVAKLSPGFACRFECVGAGRSHTDLVVLQAKPRTGHWPIPEAYLPVSNMTRLPLRDAIPLLSYKPKNVPVAHLNLGSIPADTYELVQGSLAIRIVQQKARWPVYVKNSLGDQKPGKPFGLLMCDEQSKKAVLRVLPYDFPMLAEIVSVATPGRQETEVKTLLKRYTSSIPPYYISSLRQFFVRMGLFCEFPPENTFHPTLAAYMAEKKNQAQQMVTNHSQISFEDLKHAVDWEDMLKLSRELQRQLDQRGYDASKPTEGANGTEDDDEDRAHQRPISEMGNYAHALRTKLILRDPFSEDEESTRKINFGSRYKKGKSKIYLNVDETDEAEQARRGASTKRPKRRLGARKRRRSLKEFLKVKEEEEKIAIAARKAMEEKKAKKEKEAKEARKAAEEKAEVEAAQKKREPQKSSIITDQVVAKKRIRRPEFWAENDLYTLKKQAVALFSQSRQHRKLKILEERLAKVSGNNRLKLEFISDLYHLSLRFGNNMVSKLLKELMSRCC